MYSDNEIETAVESGAIDRDAAARLRTAIAAQRGTIPADDEQFRLVTGFNDIFVTIASALVVFAVGTLLGGLAVAAVSWGLAEYFTRRRRMALPSVFLLLCYVVGVFSTFSALAWRVTATPEVGFFARASLSPDGGVAYLLAMAAVGAATAAAVWAHWRRFRVPITIAAGVMAFALVLAATATAALVAAGLDGNQAAAVLPWIAFVLGLAVFAYAMRWDLRDPERTTRRADVAFWLHLAASPLIVHPLFLQLAGVGAGDDGSPVVAALLALLLYAALGVVALVVDRRALLVSALAYVVIAMGVLLRTDGSVGSNVAVSGAVIGGLLLALSVFWRRLREVLLAGLPERYRIRLPRTGAA